jgi:hypothetical protein
VGVGSRSEVVSGTQIRDEGVPGECLGVGMHDWQASDGGRAVHAPVIVCSGVLAGWKIGLSFVSSSASRPNAPVS